ncbi:Xaa-Pro peptidase family protein [Mesorhizobium sp. NZP2077]|uniref:M24 family metallopeptidase n=1 Tax=Mesorhizobium sp. NZP2077 TaxID=2483404 RepID=UPI001557F2D8|nr:Xaa-Pro peptidase family protein [Mesorhizobium sp. NZP2077]QKC86922.1 aminopeptidase P family protein [Mesorhizobium sp. NZP2077]QKD20626.1 aminopeptidase P family protein [Mesorhizobium sp. NZP2077]
MENLKEILMLKPAFQAFSEAEHRFRLKRAREELATAGYGGSIIVAPENIFYLTGYDSICANICPQALVLSVDESRDPTLLVRNLDLPLVKETSWLADVRTYQLFVDDVAKVVGQIANDQGIAKGRLGLDMQSPAVTGSYMRALETALNLQIGDVSHLLNKLQLIKSPAEIDFMKEAARYANLGVEAARRSLQPGISEIALCAAVERAAREAGSDYPALPIECGSGARSASGHAAPLLKIIGKNELVHLEFAGVARRYHSVGMTTLATGEPGEGARKLYDVARESLVAGLEECRPGAHVADIDNGSRKPIDRAGLGDAAQMRFGVGIGIAYPPIWLSSLQLDRFSTGTLVPGMTFYVHSWLSLPRDGLGVMLGGTYLVTETGIEALSGAGPVDLFTV